MMSTETSSGPSNATPGRGLFQAAILCLCTVIWPCVSSALESAVVEIHYRNARDLLSVAAPLLGPAGRISADDRTNSLVVVDTPDAIRRITDLVRRLDRPPVTLRIDVRFDREGSAADQEVSAEGSLSGDGWRVSTGPEAEDGVHVRLRDRTRSERRKAALSVTTLSGTAAYVSVGEEIPYRQRAVEVCRRYGGCPPTVSFHRVETGFWVTPRLAGDRIDLEIVPQIADAASQKRVRFAAASTHTAVAPGRWTEIGGVSSTENAALARILGLSDAARQDAASIWLKVERIDNNR